MIYTVQYDSITIYHTKKIIHTVGTGMMGSLPRCSTAFFTKVEMVAGVEQLEGAMVVG